MIGLTVPEALASVIVLLAAGAALAEIVRRLKAKADKGHPAIVMQSQSCFATLAPMDDEAIELVDRLNELRLGFGKRIIREEISRLEAGNGEVLLKSISEDGE